MESRGFGWALEQLRLGKRVSRIGWLKQGWLDIQCPTPDSKMTQPYIYLATPDGELVPWSANQTDILAEDWIAESGV